MKWFLILLCLIGLGYFARGPIERLIYIVRLSAEPLPASFLVPVEGVAASKVRDNWGAPRGTRKHEGIDIMAACGRPVLSATRGIVSKVGENNLGGQVVFVVGPSRSWHYYAHLSRFADIKRGDIVEAGSVLGYVGNTGNARTTPCHLHYGLYLEGKARNPFPYLAPPRAASASK